MTVPVPLGYVDRDGGGLVERGVEELRLDDVLGVDFCAVVDAVESRQLATQEKVRIGGCPHPVGVVGFLGDLLLRVAFVAECRDLDIVWSL